MANPSCPVCGAVVTVPASAPVLATCDGCRAHLLVDLQPAPVAAESGQVGQVLATVRIPEALANRYAVEGAGVAGLLGTVVLAQDRLFSRPVMLKLLGRHATPQGSDAFLDALRLLAALRHPNLVQLLDLAESEGQIHVVFEDPGGETVGTVLRRRTLAQNEMAQIAVDCLAALSACHGKGLAHGEIGPDTVFVTGHGRARILSPRLRALLPTGTSLHRAAETAGPGPTMHVAPSVEGDLRAVAALLRLMATASCVPAAGASGPGRLADDLGPFLHGEPPAGGDTADRFAATIRAHVAGLATDCVPTVPTVPAQPAGERSAAQDTTRAAIVGAVVAILFVGLPLLGSLLGFRGAADLRREAVRLEKAGEDARAVELFTKAAEQGDARAQVELGYRHLKGAGVPFDAGRAVHWFRKAADQGDGSGHLFLGHCCETGQGVPRSPLEAVASYKRGVALGSTGAMLQLARCHESGHGVARDDAAAVALYDRAASGGEADAQMELGYRHLTGRGMPRDEARAIEWFRKAAEQNHAEAKAMLEDLER